MPQSLWVVLSDDSAGAAVRALTPLRRVRAVAPRPAHHWHVGSLHGI